MDKQELIEKTSEDCGFSVHAITGVINYLDDEGWLRNPDPVGIEREHAETVSALEEALYDSRSKIDDLRDDLVELHSKHMTLTERLEVNRADEWREHERMIKLKTENEVLRKQLEDRDVLIERLVEKSRKRLGLF
ncbi:hypothetical protein D3I60_11155 [Brevibacterium permense]|uniref:hypothetical protein n=1 Tax=Brevibacterium permense TaxID=234834 RepID=UPI0021D2E419|nr:hypothetical protein [Brevibacterium permense]MCU4297631.1 hypothetical protein [Brevibacterium permense]